jgi:hypothetical protein
MMAIHAREYRTSVRYLSMVGLGLLGLASCAADREPDSFFLDGVSTTQNDSDIGDSDGVETLDVGGSSETGVTPADDPETCAEAEELKTYIGCEFWPTVTANIVDPMFDFAVVVANVGDEPAEVEVDRGGTLIETVVVPPDELRTIYLPWVPELKGPVDVCTESSPANLPTMRAPDGAYHLVSSRPVVAYQFNPLQYRPQGGVAGKDWSAACAASCMAECFSFTNDASLLLPSTALTTNYRVTGYPAPAVDAVRPVSSTLAVTGTTDGTQVTVTLSQDAEVHGGPGVVHARGGEVFSFSLDAGEVVQLVGGFGSTVDLSGSLVQANAPIQVIFGLPCRTIAQAPACDHVEESVFPVETWGKRYFVAVPTSPDGEPVGHQVRIYGNVDGTKLTYPAGKPDGFPDTINAGEVVGKVGSHVVTEDFEVVGDHEFAVSTFQLSMLALGTYNTTRRGDPSQSNVTAVEQFRHKYVFLAPLDYPVSFVDVIQPMNAQVDLDGAPAAGELTAIGSSGYGVRRVPLGDGKDGAHVLTADQPVGIQVMGYGRYTSYQYPGGLNLEAIAPPPPPVL